jgi:hypothetical protein
MAKMLGKTWKYDTAHDRAPNYSCGCCQVKFGYSRGKGRKQERRYLRRIEKRSVRKEIFAV